MPIFAETFWRLEGQCQSLRLRQTMKNPHQIESSVDRKLLTKWRWEKSFYLKLKPTNFLRQALKHESNGTTWQIALLFCLFDGELLFVNTRLSVKVKLSVFNLVKAIQSCKEEVKIWSKNFWAYKCNTCSYCHYAFKPRRKQSQGTQHHHLFNIYFALKWVRDWWDRKIFEHQRFH